jgi:hypothetical protein
MLSLKDLKPKQSGGHQIILWLLAKHEKMASRIHTFVVHKTLHFERQNSEASFL